MHTKDFGGAAAACNLAVAGPEHRNDVVVLDLVQRLESRTDRFRSAWDVSISRLERARQTKDAIGSVEHRPLDDVPQLANIPRPIVALELTQHLWRDFGDLDSMPLRENGCKMSNEHLDILAPIP